MKQYLSPDIPISISTLTEQNRHEYLDLFQSVGVGRVWLCGYDDLLFEEANERYASTLLHLRETILFFRENGLEVGAWVRDLGFGTPMLEANRHFPWTRIRSVMGTVMDIDAYCPEDPDFRRAYLHFIEEVAKCDPDLIMLDDDLCLSIRPGIGCFCDHHLKKLSEKLGETVTLDGLAGRMFTGGRNPARDAWLDTNAETFTAFCTDVRETVHRIDPDIRVGFCAGYTSWDMEGIDALSLTKVLAGKHRPYLRLTGAPYWCNHLTPRFHGQKMNAVIECVREQVAWCQGEDVEIMAENDSYPRPAYQVSARLLEELSYATAAIGIKELKYLCDYESSPTYESMYARMHRRNTAMYHHIAEAFQGLTDCGVRLYRSMRTIRDIELPETCMGEHRIMRLFFSGAAAMLTQLGIPVCYDGQQNIGAAFGHDATALPIHALPKKLILDLPAARILQSRGVDVGLCDARPVGVPDLEVFHTRRDSNERISISNACLGISDTKDVFYAARLAAAAVVESVFIVNGHTVPSSYRYRNGETEYLVLLFDATAVGQSCSAENSYCRQRQLMDFMGYTFPRIEGHPELYVLCKESNDGNRRSVLFENIGDDPLFDAKIELDRFTTAVSLWGAEGMLSADGQTVYLHSTLYPGEAMLLTVEYGGNPHA